MVIDHRFIWILTLMLDATGLAFGNEPEDSYLWLEDVTGADSLAWVKERNAESMKELTGSPSFQALDRPHPCRSWIPRTGSRASRSWGRITIISGATARTRAACGDARPSKNTRRPNPAWEVVLDLDLLGKEEKENWVWHGAQVLKPDYKRALVSLSRGGADASVVREFDLAGKMFVGGGFRLPEAKSQVAWRNRDSVFVGTDFGPGSLTESGYPRIVKEWKRGTPLAEAALVMEG